jgi:site-specific DNA-methyltransferase (adenine-specific)
MTITNEDNMELMARYPDKYFDLAIVDPPYGINKIWVGGCGNGWGKAREESKKRNWDNDIPKEEYFIELQRVSKNQIIWGGNYFTKYLNPSRCWLSWLKPERGFSLSEFELAWTSFDKVTRVFEYMRNEIGRTHPTQKPIKLYKWILENYAKPNDKILDTHLGSGSIAIACHDYGFDLTACELDKEYYDKAMKRINNHILQQKLF